MVSKFETTRVILCGGADVGGSKARTAEARGHAEKLKLRKQTRLRPTLARLEAET
jgi:hypothetical protein